MNMNNLTTGRIYLDLTPKERADIAMGACKDPYADTKVPIRRTNGQIQRHVPLRHDESRSDLMEEVIRLIAFRIVDATVHEAFRYAAEWLEQRKGRSSHAATEETGTDEIAHPGDDGARNISEEPASNYPDAEIIDLRAAREWRASVG